MRSKQLFTNKSRGVNNTMLSSLLPGLLTTLLLPLTAQGLSLTRQPPPPSRSPNQTPTPTFITTTRTTHDAPLFLYNSRTRSKEAFTPLRPPLVSMYTCGPTVYDSAHVGNFRAFLTYDLLKRVLLYLGFDVTHVCNLTDIDDKIIQRANLLKKESIHQITEKYAQLFFADLRALNILPATHYPRATEHVNAMMDMIQSLSDKGLAYETSDGSWYFRTQRQPGYGQQLTNLPNLQQQQSPPQQQQQQQQLPEEEDQEKEHKADFCLWKAFKPGIDREDAVWSSLEQGIQRGRPGWHLECSAMCQVFFGSDTTIDLHGGGIDLKFPHHENEIAQSQGVFSDPNQLFCQCWFHNGFVNINDEKMSKSLGNFLTLSKACPTPADVRAYRYLVISSQYRNPLSFTEQAMQAAKNAITRIDKVRADMARVLSATKVVVISKKEDGDDLADDDIDNKNSRSSSSNLIATKAVPAALNNFEVAIRDDLSMPRAAAALFSLVKEAEKQLKLLDDTQRDIIGLQAISDALHRMDQVFGIFYAPPGAAETDKHVDSFNKEEGTEIPMQVLQLVSQRSEAKAAKDWELADSLRSRIAELGFAIKDVKDGEPIITQVQQR